MLKTVENDGGEGVNFVALGFVHDVDINLFSFKNLIAYHFLV